MSWVLQASGHVDREITDESEWAKIEDELATALHKVLSDPKFGAVHSFLGLRLVQGPVHKAGEPLPKGAPADPDAEDAPPRSGFLTPDQMQAAIDAPPAAPAPSTPPADDDQDGQDDDDHTGGAQ